MDSVARSIRTPSRLRRLVGGVAAVALVAAIVVVAPWGVGPAQADVSTGVISGGAPLARVAMDDEFQDQMVHATISPGLGAFYDQRILDYGTRSTLALFEGASTVVAAYSDNAQTFGGSGSRSNPWWIRTQASASSPAGFTIGDRLSYVDGDTYYRSDITVTNQGSTARVFSVYRYNDCVLAGDDNGYSVIPTTAADCTNPQTAISLIPVTAGANLQSGNYDAIEDRMDRNEGFTNTCLGADGNDLSASQCKNVNQDNAAGVSWEGQTLAPGASASYSYLVNYSATSPLFSALEPSSSASPETPETVRVGDTFEIDLELENTGPADTDGATMTIPVSPNYRVDDYGGDGVFDEDTGTWSVGELDAGDTVDLTLYATAIAAGEVPVGATSAQSSNIDNAPCAIGSAVNCGPQPTVTIVDVSALHSDYTVSTGSRLANGSDAHTVTVKLRDTTGQAVTDAVDAIAASASPAGAVTIGAFAESGTAGTYTADVTSSIVGRPIITVRIVGESTIPLAQGGNDRAEFVAGPPGTLSTVTIDDSSPRLADGEQLHEMTVTLRDDSDHPTDVDPTRLSATSDPGVTVGAFARAAAGSYQVAVVSTAAGTHAVQVFLDGTTLLGTVDAVFEAGPIDLESPDTVLELDTVNPMLVSDPATVSSDDAERVHVMSAHLSDAHGNPIGGEAVTFDLPPGLAVVGGDGAVVTTGADGIATVRVASSSARAYSVSATVEGGQIVNGSPIEPTFTVDTEGPVESTLATSDGAVEADGVMTHRIEVTVTDAFGNPVPGQSVAVSLAPELTVVLGTSNGLTDEEGEFWLTVSSATAGTFAVDADVRGVPVTPSASVTFSAGAASPTDSTFVVAPTGPIAAGLQYSGTVTLNDANGNSVPDAAVTFTLADDIDIVEPGPHVTDAAGSVIVHFTSTVAGSHSVAADVGADPIATHELTFVAAPADPGNAGTALARTTPTVTVVADGASEHRVTATVVDAYGNPVAGQDVAFAVPPALTSDAGSTVPTDASGTAVIALTSTVAGDYDVTATVDGSAIVTGSPVEVAFVAGDPTPEDSTLTIDPAGPLAVGTGEAATYSARVRLADAQGNPVAGTQVLIESSPQLEQSAVGGVTDSAGEVTVALTSTVPGTFAISAQAHGLTIDSQTRVYSEGPPDLGVGGHSRLLASTGPRVADGVQTHTVTAQLRDSFGNPLAGQPVSFEVPSGLSAVGGTTLTTDSAGDATLRTVSTTPGSYTVSAYAGSSTGDQAARIVNGDPVELIFEAGDPDPDASTLTVSPAGPLPVGTDPASAYTATVRITDPTGNPIGGIAVDVSVIDGEDQPVNGQPVLSGPAPLTDSTGSSSVTVRSTLAGSFRIVALIDGVEVSGSDASVSWVAGAPLAMDSSLTVSDGDVIADGVAQHTATITARDRYGNIVTDSPGDVVFSLEVQAPASGSTEAPLGPSGVVTLPITSTVAGRFTVTAELDGSPVYPGALTVEFGADSASADESTILASPAVITADGAATSVVTVRLRDDRGNPLATGGAVVTMSADSGTLTAVTDHDDGTYTAVLTAPTAPGIAHVGFTVDGEQSGKRAQVEFVAGPTVPGRSTIVASPTSLPADGVSTSTITVTARDQNGNRVTGGGEVVTLSTDAGTLSSATDNDDGTYTALLTAQTAPGSATVGFAIDGTAGTATAVVSFVAGAADLVTSTIAAAPSTLEADGVSISTVTVVLVDAFANPLPGRTVTMTSSAGTLGPVTDQGDGSYTADLTAPRRPGTATVGFAADTEASPRTATVDFVDTTPPPPPTIQQPTAGQRTGPQPPVSGLAEPEATVTVSNGDGMTVCETIAAADGTWSCTPSAPLPLGPQTVYATATDFSGNVSPESEVQQFVVVHPLSITVGDTEVAQGGTTVVIGRGFAPGESVAGVLASEPLSLGTHVADSSGTVTFTILVPVDFATGRHTVTLTGATSGSVSAPLVVVGTMGQAALAATGLTVTALAILSALLVGLGAAAQARRRRRAG